MRVREKKADGKNKFNVNKSLSVYELNNIFANFNRKWSGQLTDSSPYRMLIKS